MSPQTERSSMSRQRARVCAALLIASCAKVSLASGQPQIQNSARAIPFASRSSPLAVVLTTDCGAEIDDQWALAHLALSPEVDLQAVITTHASSIRLSSATAAQHAADVLAQVSPARLPLTRLVAGSDVPLQDVRTPRKNAGVDLLLRLSRKYSESSRLAVLIIGPGTDVASAVLQDPSIVRRIAIVAMSFNDWPGGGDGFNVKNDPLAWQVILNSDVPVVIGSGAVALRHLKLTRAEASALMQSHGSVGGYLYGLFDDWLTQRAELVARLGAPGTWAIWDEVVVAYALGLARGNEVPRPYLESNLSFSHPETARRLTWLTEIDTERLWLDFTGKIDAMAARK
jgi:purine nucleosidase